MHQPHAVDDCEAVRGLFEHVEGHVFFELAFAGDEVGEGFAADVFHGDEAHGEPAVGFHFAVVIRGDHVGGVDPLRGVGFIAEAREELLVGGEFRPQHFEGYFAFVADVVGKPDGGHAAVPDDPLQLVVGPDELL